MPDVLPVSQGGAPPSPAAVRGVRVAFLLNVIAPYHKPLFDHLSRRYSHFRILLSAAMERNRSWKLEWQGLDVVLQKTVTLDRRWHHPKGFSEPLFVHLPLDTIAQLARFKAQIVVSWEMGLRTMLAAVYRWLHPGTKLMVWAEFAESTEHGRGALRRHLRRVLHHAVDAFIVTGASGARYLGSIGVPRRKIHQIVYTTNVERFAAVPPRRAPEGAWRLLYVGQLIERKGLLPFVDLLGRWAAEHPSRSVELTLAGDGPLRDALQQAARPPNLQLHFLGDVSYEALPAVYAASGIFAFPTLADTWGVVVNEALASGLPVLGSLDGQAVSELVIEGANGWTFHSSSPDEMRAALDRALATPLEVLDAMRARARATALRLTPEYLADLVDRAILSCLGEPRTS